MKHSLCPFLFVLVVLSACAAPATPAPTITPFPTQVLPTATTTPPPSVLAGTPVLAPGIPINLENLNRLSPLAHWGKGSVVETVISPQGRMIAVATPAGVYLYDAESFEETRFIESKSWLSSIAFAPDESLLALGALDGSVQVLQVSDGSRKKTFSSPLGAIASLGFSGTGNLLVAGDTS